MPTALELAQQRAANFLPAESQSSITAPSSPVGEGQAFTDAITSIYGSRFDINAANQTASVDSILENIRNIGASSALQTSIARSDIAAADEALSYRTAIRAHDIRTSNADLDATRAHIGRGRSQAGAGFNLREESQDIEAYNNALGQMYGSNSAAGIAVQGDRNLARQSNIASRQLDLDRSATLDSFDFRLSSAERSTEAGNDRTRLAGRADKAATKASADRTEMAIQLQQEQAGHSRNMQNISLQLEQTTAPLEVENLLGQQAQALAQFSSLGFNSVLNDYGVN